MSDKIYNLDLRFQDQPASFVIKTMEEVDNALGGISDEPHRHNYYTVIWPMSATGRHIIDFREYRIETNQLFFVSPRQVHQVITDPNPTGIVILFTPEFLQKNSIREDFIANLKLFRDSNDTPPLPITDEMAGRLKIHSDAMFNAFRSENDFRFETIGAHLKLFLIECNGHCSLFPGSNTQNIEVGRLLVRNFKELVERHHHEWHQVKDYASELNVSPNYLSEVIKSSINGSAKEYIQNRIILEAKRMTLFTGKSVKEIGFDLGFDDPAHFSKFFKSSTGYSFQEFKESVYQ